MEFNSLTCIKENLKKSILFYLDLTKVRVFLLYALQISNDGMNYLQERPSSVVLLLHVHEVYYSV